MADLAPAVPQGGTYASSADGLRFEKSGVLFTAAQNPTVYNRPDGSLGLADYVRLWRSDRFGGWTVADDTKHARGDCPSVFSWKGHSYVIQGFFMMDHSASGKPGTWEAWEESGDDLYEGLAVPMVAPWHGDRRILAGWINHVHGSGRSGCPRRRRPATCGPLRSRRGRRLRTRSFRNRGRVWSCASTPLNGAPSSRTAVRTAWRPGARRCGRS